MELGNENATAATYTPPPEVPVKVHCYPKSESVQEAWLKIMPNVEFCRKEEECKILILNVGMLIGRDCADKMWTLLARDGAEALIYRYDSLSRRFIALDRIWLDIPGRVIPDYGTRRI